MLQFLKYGRNTICKTGRTGGLPHTGTGWYRFNFTATKTPDNSKRILLQFDGAMSNAEVFINGIKAGSHPYGYSYFLSGYKLFNYKRGKSYCC